MIFETKKQIYENGIIRLSKPKIDFFSYVVKTIISQQISDNVADSIWQKFCKYFEKNIDNILLSSNINIVENAASLNNFNNHIFF